MSEGKVITFPKKSTIVKNRVGVVKLSVRSLPDTGHVYGYRPPADVETSGEIISKWVTSNASVGKEDGKSVIISNMLAVKHGCTTSKQIRAYTLQHPNYRRIEPVREEVRRIDEKHTGPFGIKTVYSEETIAQIIQAKYTDFSTEDRDYPDVKNTIHKSQFPKPKPTVASESVSRARDLKTNEKRELNFTMTRFKNIQAKVNMGPAT